jgi:methylmalonyl-CoA/ethylmalonyl-CoA epimerase
MTPTVDHVGIAVRDLEAALRFYRDALGLPVGPPEEVVSQGVRVRFVQTGGTALELIEATTPESPVARFLATRGPGLHHVAFAVADLTAALATLKARGVRLVDEVPRPGAHGTRVAFVHPASAHGVLVELVEKP